MTDRTRVHTTVLTPALRTLHQSPAGRRLSCPLDHGVLKSQGSGHLGPQHSALPLDHKLLSINEANEAQEVLGGLPRGQPGGES